ncbi:MAG: DUF1641 domain-containing protein [Anaerolineales bacterium]|nr:DUF1641 domain-containing protein [Anaerolineales bacterium]MCB8937119.1 DUF1641 domain-containing protein [Ardenticatenaceae bacterium]
MQSMPINGSATLQAKLNEPQTVAALTRLLDRIESLEQTVNTLADLVTQGPGMAAMVGDMVDETVRSAAARGVDVEQRLQTALTLAEKLTAPAMVDKLDRLLALADEAPGMAAMVGDMVDETVRSAAARGVDIEARLRAGLAIAEKLTAPDMVAKLDQLLAFANEAPGLVAMVGDMVDETAVTLDLESRLKMGLQIAEKATQPANLAQLGEMFEVLLEAESGMLSPDAVRTLGSMAQSMVAAKSDPRPKVGLLALLRSLNDPDIQNTLGFLLNFGKRFGRSL